MLPTDILSSEHRVIEQVIAVLEEASRRLEAGRTVRPGVFVDAAEFLREFADGYHHAKEEGVLFEAMGRNGMPIDGGPIGVMLHEHDRARELTARLREASQRLAAGDRDAMTDVVDNALAYADLLTQHIYKEDNILFPMAAQWLVPQDQDTMLGEFERVERDRAGRARPKASYVDLARALCAEMAIGDATPRREVALPCHAR
jgi:hemerythrin-like domain-containing protein